MLRPSNPNDKHLTAVEVQAWQRERDEKKEDFPFIHLSDSEKSLLMKCELDRAKATEENRNDAVRLRDLDFIFMQRSDSKSTENTEFCEIRDRGRNYLKYLYGEAEKERRQFSHNWKVAIFSAFAGALLARPVWAGIDWILQIIAKLIAE